jgi:hypothetical protein
LKELIDAGPGALFANTWPITACKMLARKMIPGPQQEVINVVLPERQTDPQGQARRLSLQGVRLRLREEEETLPSKKG